MTYSSLEERLTECTINKIKCVILFWHQVFCYTPFNEGLVCSFHLLIESHLIKQKRLKKAISKPIQFISFYNNSKNIK